MIYILALFGILGIAFIAMGCITSYFPELKEFKSYVLVKDMIPLLTSLAALSVSWLTYSASLTSTEDSFIGPRNVACFATRLIIPRIEEAIRGDYAIEGKRAFPRNKESEYNLIIYALQQVPLYSIRPPEYSEYIGDILRISNEFKDLQSNYISNDADEQQICELRNQLKHDALKLNEYAQLFSSDRLVDCENDYSRVETRKQISDRKRCDHYGRNFGNDTQ